jgi:manganese/zinc/iron transport system substrate-binding protein
MLFLNSQKMSLPRLSFAVLARKVGTQGHAAVDGTRLGRRFWIAPLSALALCAGCREDAGRADWATAAERPLRVVCTTGIVADMVRNVGGPNIQVATLMRDGIDPHTYKACMGDIHALAGADVVFYSGLHLEGKLAEVLERLGRKKRVVALASAFGPGDLISQDGGVADPHVWFDVSLWSRTIDVVERTLSSMDPQRAGEYAERAESHRRTLTALHEEVKARLASIPRERRVLVTAHDAFQYFSRAYDIEVRAIQGVSTESEAGLREINALVQFLVDRGIKAVFVESTIDESNVRALIEGCAARGRRVTIGGELYSDSMGPPHAPEGTYVGMVRHNVEVVARALQ